MFEEMHGNVSYGKVLKLEQALLTQCSALYKREQFSFLLFLDVFENREEGGVLRTEQRAIAPF